MNLPDNNPFVTSLLKRNLLFTCSAADTDLFIADPDADIYDQACQAVNQLIENCEKHGMTKQNLRKLSIYYVNDPSVRRYDLLNIIAQQLDYDALPVVTLIPFKSATPESVKNNHSLMPWPIIIPQRPPDLHQSAVISARQYAAVILYSLAALMQSTTTIRFNTRAI